MRPSDLTVSAAASASPSPVSAAIPVSDSPVRLSQWISVHTSSPGKEQSSSPQPFFGDELLSESSQQLLEKRCMTRASSPAASYLSSSTDQLDQAYSFLPREWVDQPIQCQEDLSLEDHALLLSKIRDQESTIKEQESRIQEQEESIGIQAVLIQGLNKKIGRMKPKSKKIKLKKSKLKKSKKKQIKINELLKQGSEKPRLAEIKLNNIVKVLYSRLGSPAQKTTTMKGFEQYLEDALRKYMDESSKDALRKYMDESSKDARREHSDECLENALIEHTDESSEDGPKTHTAKHIEPAKVIDTFPSEWVEYALHASRHDEMASFITYVPTYDSSTEIVEAVECRVTFSSPGALAPEEQAKKLGRIEQLIVRRDVRREEDRKELNVLRRAKRESKKRLVERNLQLQESVQRLELQLEKINSEAAAQTTEGVSNEIQAPQAALLQEVQPPGGLLKNKRPRVKICGMSQAKEDAEQSGPKAKRARYRR